MSACTKSSNTEKTVDGYYLLGDNGITVGTDTFMYSLDNFRVLDKKSENTGVHLIQLWYDDKYISEFKTRTAEIGSKPSIRIFKQNDYYVIHISTEIEQYATDDTVVIYSANKNITKVYDNKSIRHILYTYEDGQDAIVIYLNSGDIIRVNV